MARRSAFRLPASLLLACSLGLALAATARASGPGPAASSPPSQAAAASVSSSDEALRQRFESVQSATVGVKVRAVEGASSIRTLGRDREGSGVVIAPQGLVLTIGYLITEAETVWLITHDGRAVPGHALAFDQISGFGLVQALGRLNLPAIEFGDSDSLKVGAEAVMAAAGGRQHAIEAKVVGRQEFAGYWEYLLDNAISTAPAR